MAEPATHKGVYYFKTPNEAKEHAKSIGLENARIVEYERGHAVQAGPSGGYSGPAGKPKPWTGTVGNNPMEVAGSRQAHGYGHSASQREGSLRLSGNPKAHRIGKR